MIDEGPSKRVRERCPLCDRDGKINVVELDFGLVSPGGILGPVVCKEKHGTHWYIGARGLPMVADAHSSRVADEAGPIAPARSKSTRHLSAWMGNGSREGPGAHVVPVNPSGDRTVQEGVADCEDRCRADPLRVGARAR
jgi:hypothetical protein